MGYFAHYKGKNVTKGQYKLKKAANKRKGKALAKATAQSRKRRRKK